MNRQSDLDRFESRRSTMYGTEGVVATSQPLAAEAGISMLKSGGNAFDAAVATAATLAVVEPMSTGLGGDVFVIYRTAEGEVSAMRACGGAPEAATIGAVRSAIASEREITADDAEFPDRGALTVTVPGAPRGWEIIIDELGHCTLSTVLADAIRYATEGFPVSEVIASMWQESESELRGTVARDAYLIDGKRAPRVGERMVLPELGKTLEILGKEGADPFYEGEIADRIVQAVQSRGGLLDGEDLCRFEPDFVEPIQTTYHGSTVYELPPNNQGLVALEALNIAEQLDVGTGRQDDVKWTHRLVEATKLAFHDGHHYITDPEYKEIPPLDSKAYAAHRSKAVGKDALKPSEIGPRTSPAEDADTVLLTVADGDGNVVSFINSLFMNFGSGLVADKTGILLQNRGASFTLDPDHPNHIQPGKRPFHTLIPGLVRFDEDDWAAFGVMGGYMQPQGHVQIISNLVDKNCSLQAALDEPRWRYMADGTLNIEARFNENTASKLVRRGHSIGIEVPTEFGGGQIVRNSKGVLSGATEPRKDGQVSVY